MNSQSGSASAPTTDKPPKYTLYPRRYFDLAPTWFEWNKLSIADIRSLRDEPGFAGQKIGFHLNHPIQFVCVVGVVLDIILTAGGRYVLITLDDGSGACIPAKITSRVECGGGGDTTAGSSLLFKATVDSVDVRVQLGVPSVYVRGERMEIGTVLKVKARLDSWFNERQLQLERVWIVKDTNAEAREWSEIAAWKHRHLNTPWVLSADEMARFDERKEQEDEQLRREQAKHAAKAKRHADKREIKRQLEEKELDDGALAGSHVLPAPWA